MKNVYKISFIGLYCHYQLRSHIPTRTSSRSFIEGTEMYRNPTKQLRMIERATGLDEVDGKYEHMKEKLVESADRQ